MCPCGWGVCVIVWEFVGEIDSITLCRCVGGCGYGCMGVWVDVGGNVCVWECVGVCGLDCVVSGSVWMWQPWLIVCVCLWVRVGVCGFYCVGESRCVGSLMGV